MNKAKLSSSSLSKQSKSEHEIQNEIKLFVESYLKGYCLRINSGGVVNGRILLAPAGTPDLLACINGIFIAIEVKKGQSEIKNWKKKEELFRKTAHLSIFASREIAQIKTQDKIRKANGIYILTYSLEDFNQQLTKLSSKPKIK